MPQQSQPLRELVEALGRRVRADTHGWIHNFYTIYFSGMVLSGLIGGGIIAGIDGIPFLDGFYLAVSALTCTGLASVPMSVLSTGSFVVIAILCLFGQSFMAMNVYPCIGRYFWASRRRPTLPGLKQKTIELTVWVMVSYIFFWHVFGILGLIGAFRIRPHNAELSGRNFTREAQALHLTICAFANAGYTLTSDSIYDLRDNPLAYTIIALLISAGCTMTPPFLRAYLLGLRWCRVNLLKIEDVSEYDELLVHGEEYSSYLFGSKGTKYLLFVTLSINAAQFLLFCFSELIRKDALDAYGSPAVLVGMGFFQAVSTRYAGFQIMDLRLVSSGMVVLYTVFMYLPPTPGVDEYQDPSFKVVEDRDSDAGSERDRDSQQDDGSVNQIEKKHSSDSFLYESRQYDENGIGQRPQRPLSHRQASFRIEHRTSYDKLAIEPETGGDREGLSVKVKRRHSSSSMSLSLDEDEEVRPASSATVIIGRHKDRRASGRFAKPTMEDSIITWVSGYSSRLINVAKNHDLWLVLCLLILSFTEDNLMQEQPTTFSIWFIFFEIISAYGNVGLSMGIPGKPYSLSGDFSKMGYLVIIFVMFMGKHRGMPSVDAGAIDFYWSDASSNSNSTNKETDEGKEKEKETEKGKDKDKDKEPKSVIGKAADDGMASWSI